MAGLFDEELERQRQQLQVRALEREARREEECRAARRHRFGQPNSLEPS